MKKFREIKTLLLNYFPENWTEEKNLEKTLPKKVDKINEEIFDIITESLLGGEYIVEDYKTTKNSISELKKFINQHFDIIGLELDLQEVLEKNINKKLVSFNLTLLTIYDNFIAQISLLTTHPFHKVSFSINYDNRYNLEPNKSQTEQLRIFTAYINVQIIDHFFNDSERVFQSLSSLLKILKNTFIPSKLKASVIEKIEFLKHKWILRQYDYSQKDESHHQKGYIVDGEIREYFGEEEFRSKNEKLIRWSNYLENHYHLDSNFFENIKRSTHSIKNEKLEDLSLLDIHRLIKYYKDHIKDKKELRSIVDFLIEKAKFNNNSYNSNIDKKAAIYALNNYFSLLIDLKEPQNKIKEVRDEIESFQNKFNIANFFADKKYLNYQINEIDSLYNNREILNNLEDESRLLSGLSKIIERCKKRLDWAFDHHSLIFQLHYEDSFVPTQNSSLGIFYASTFSLPMAEETNRKEFRDIELKYDKLNILTQSLSSLKLEFDKIKEFQENLRETKEEVKNTDFKSLEIVGIFAAIVTFVMSLVSSLEFINSFKTAIYFYVTVGASLTTMIMVIFLMRKGFENVARNWINILSLILLIIITLISWKYIPDF